MLAVGFDLQAYSLPFGRRNDVLGKVFFVCLQDAIIFMMSLAKYFSFAYRTPYDVLSKVLLVCLQDAI